MNLRFLHIYIFILQSRFCKDTIQNILTHAFSNENKIEFKKIF